MGDGSFWLPEAGSSLASELDVLFYFVIWVSTIIFVLVVAAMAYFTVKYRRKSPNERPPLLHEHKLLETAWIVIPTILVLIVFTWGFRSYVKLTVAPADAYEVYVEGYKWGWRFIHPDPGFEDPYAELTVPVGRPIKLIMSSDDVLHSFFIPAFRVKHDVLPNRYTSLWFEAEEEGQYQVFCTEYCGTQHSGMLAEVNVVSEEEFAEYLSSRGGDLETLPLVEHGEILYGAQACANCHTVDGSSLVGPSFQGLFGATREFQDGTSAIADEDYLRESIINPHAKAVVGYPAQGMPNTYQGFSERELSALVEFIKAQE
ncbi:MAG: cytochrome c oxidase subunit II [Rhodothermales bacterium]